MEILKDLLPFYLAAINIFAFFAYGIDKRRAVKGKWRISEKTLLASSLLGGFAGAFLGMKVFSHKTKHWYFYGVVLVSAVLWEAAVFKLYFQLS